MKNNVYPCKPQFYYIKVGFKWVKIIKLYRRVFVMSFGSILAYCHIFEIGDLLMYTLEGVSSVANITVYEESQHNGNSHFLICNMFFDSKCNHFDIYFR